MAEVANIHERIRDAVAAAIVAVCDDLCLSPARVYRQTKYETNQVSTPCVVVCYDLGTEQVRGGTNLEDEIAYPVLVGLYVAGPVNGTVSDCNCDGHTHPERPPYAGPSLTQFRDTVRALFHNKRLPAVPDVFGCEIVPQPVVVQETGPGFEQLATAVGVVASAYVPRVPTWSRT